MGNPDLRLAALKQFDTAWTEAINAGTEAKRAFIHLGESLTKMAEHGSRQTLSFDDELVQRWWVVYQEMQGQMIPSEPDLPPIPVASSL